MQKIIALHAICGLPLLSVPQGNWYPCAMAHNAVNGPFEIAARNYTFIYFADFLILDGVASNFLHFSKQM
jgi:hypothetical protein